MNVLVTGATGFVGPYVIEELKAHEHTTYTLDRSGKADFTCDIMNKEQLAACIQQCKPDAIIHLAGFSSVGKSFVEPEKCHNINVNGTKNLLTVIEQHCPQAKILIISSAEAYGLNEGTPLKEEHALNPTSPYGKSRKEQEAIAQASPCNTIIARSCNHIGKGQAETFVIPAWKKQIAQANDGETIKVGNIDITRDFSYVTDVAKAYRLLIEKGTIGETYNIGSGKGYKLKDILHEMITQSGKQLHIEIDNNLIRPTDIPCLICDNTKLARLGARFEKINWNKIVQE